MPITKQDLVAAFGRVVDAGNAAVLVGAGLSQQAGYPGWGKLLRQPRDEAEIPPGVTDLPLVAQYFEYETPGGRDALEAHILGELSNVAATPTAGHVHLAEIPVGDVWTTNYDCLLEQVMSRVTVVTNEEELTRLDQPGTRRLIKMHGSLTMTAPPTWRTRPIITRHDYETYEQQHIGLTALLRATYLTKSLLFLGFSFADPNVDVLLRLSRTGQVSPKHYTVLRRPEDPGDLRLHKLRSFDLERAGVSVCEIDSYSELEPLLLDLARRTRRRWLFVSGSDSPAQYDKGFSAAIGVRLADHDLSLVSLAGPAALDVSLSFGRGLKAQGRYAAERIRLYFRSKKEAPPPPLPERIGTAIYTDMDQAPLREYVLRRSRAMLLLGGGRTTAEEVTLARKLGIPIIPVAATGGEARTTWEEGRGNSVTDVDLVSEADWNALADADTNVTAAAVQRVVLSTMYLDQVAPIGIGT